MKDPETDTESALTFPCKFPIKAMGRAGIDLDVVIVEIIRRHVQDLHEGTITSRLSKNGKYTSITITIEATSRQQLDAIYLELSAHPDVLMAL